MAAQRVFIIGLFIWLGAILTGVNAQAYEASIYASVQTQTTPPRITINWLGSYNVTGYQIWRKLKGGTSWGSPVATLDASALSWVDNSVAVGVSYEYMIVRTSLNVGSGYSYINAGVELPMVESRGKVIVLVDDYFSSSLAPQLDQLVQDMEGDGWVVLRHDVSRSASVPSIKNIVVNDYNADPVNTKMVFLVAHVPVPYSGNMAADGHWEHLGAWSADVFYADVNGTWTDNQVNATGAVDPRNHNVPGDGKYDQSNIPSTVELAVGRVDFYDLPVFSESETTLMGNYLTKLHNWKSGALSPPIRALVDDNFQGYNAAFASNAYRGFSPLVGSVNVQDLDYFSTLPNQSYLWSYACGGGNWDNALGGGLPVTLQRRVFGAYSIFSLAVPSVIMIATTISCGPHWGAGPCSLAFGPAIQTGFFITWVWARPLGFPQSSPRITGTAIMRRPIPKQARSTSHCLAIPHCGCPWSGPPRMFKGRSMGAPSILRGP